MPNSLHYRHSLEHKSLGTRMGMRFFKLALDRPDGPDGSSLPPVDLWTFSTKARRQSVGSRVFGVDFFLFFLFRPEGGALGNIYLALLLYFVISLYTKVQEGCKSGGGDVEVMPWVSGDCFQLCFTRFLGGPTGGIC